MDSPFAPTLQSLPPFLFPAGADTGHATHATGESSHYRTFNGTPVIALASFLRLCSVALLRLDTECL